jgi:glutamate carboxypeptidase
VNVVPDRAVAHLNVRADTRSDQEHALDYLEELRRNAGSRSGFTVDLHGSFQAPAKPFESGNRRLFEATGELARRLGIEFEGTSSGGVCDGNHLWAEGLPNVDTLGPVGGNIHSEDEYLEIDSLVPRAKLATLILLEYARGDLPALSG